MNTVVLVALAGLVAAQTPTYKGQLLLQPGRTSAKCLQAENRDGAPVVLADCVGGASQKWTFSGGSVKLYGNKCLDVKDGANVNGVKLQVWTCAAGNPNQQFYYTSDNRLAWTNHGRPIAHP
jgi:hypothetical protein